MTPRRRPFLLLAISVAVALLFVVLRGPFLASSLRSVTVLRGPYLQDAGTTDILVVWRTSTPVTGAVRYGPTQGPPWAYVETGASGQTDHAIRLSGLAPDTRYSYQLLADGVAISGIDELRTYPPQNSTKPFRFVAWGDSGTGDGLQLQLASCVSDLSPAAELYLGLGDLVYPTGEWEDYDPHFFEPYSPMMRRALLWTSIGNHDAGTGNGAPYYANFHLPTDSGAPSHPSGTESYYSFDYGMAHFVCVDTLDDINAGDPQYNWLEADLDDANARGVRWKIVYTHKPPYSRGSHNSDFEGDLVRLRDHLIPLCESKGVDLFLSGHSHNYERSYLISNGAILQNHPSEYTKSFTGTIYVVSGCGGKSGSGAFGHPLMAYDLGFTTGVSVFDVSNDEVHGYFLQPDNSARDLFTLRKSSDTTPPRVAAAQVTGDDSSQLLVTFSEPVAVGGGVNGCENPSNYLVVGGGAISSATLQTDQRSVLLQSTPFNQGGAYILFVNNVADRAATPNLIRAAAISFDMPVVSGVPENDTWRYFKGLTFPGAGWATLGYNDASWLTGPSGFGYSDGDDTTFLGDMQGNYVSVYTRRVFSMPDVSAATRLSLRVSYDDGFVAFLNGVEVARSNVPSGQDHTTEATDTHEANGFELFDLTGYLGLLSNGNNVLAVEGHNYTQNDFSLHPVLEIEGVNASGEQPPVALLTSDLQAANVPATVTFDTSSTFDPDGTIDNTLLLFGDSTLPVSSAMVTHTYTEPGLYTATLIATDDDGLQTVDERPIYVHSTGTPPMAMFTVATALPEAGDGVLFDSTGSLDADGGALSLQWDFGDPSSGANNASAATTPTHIYTYPGTYTVTLLVTDDEGSQACEKQNVLVGGDPPLVGGGGGCRIEVVDDATPDPMLACILFGAFALLARRRWLSPPARAGRPGPA